MIHILSDRYRREFARSVEAVRLCLTHAMDSGSRSIKPGVLIKATTLKLKYLIRLRTFSLVYSKFSSSNCLWYGVQVEDDPATPATLWSIAEHDEEIRALDLIARSEESFVYLFNEEDMHVASAQVRMHTVKTGELNVLTEVTLGSGDIWRHYESEVVDLLAPNTKARLFELQPAEQCAWIENRATLITRNRERCHLTLTTLDEGAQQESMAEWLIDILEHPSATRNPLVHENRRTRELTDLLLSHEYGCFLLESKTLAIFDRVDIPDRRILKKNVLKHVDKAINQLIGACANIRRGLPICDKSGRDITLARDWPVHCIILVPDLSLIADCETLIPRSTLRLLNQATAFLNLVDLNELHNLVYNACEIAAQSQKLTRLMAFDVILMKRCEFAGRQNTPDFRFKMTPFDKEQ